MTKQQKKHQYIGRDMYKRDVNSEYNDKHKGRTLSSSDESLSPGEDRQENTPVKYQATLIDKLSGYAIEIVVVLVLLFVVISTAFSYQSANVFLPLQASHESVFVKLVNLER